MNIFKVLGLMLLTACVALMLANPSYAQSAAFSELVPGCVLLVMLGSTLSKRSEVRQAAEAEKLRELRAWVAAREAETGRAGRAHVNGWCVNDAWVVITPLKSSLVPSLEPRLELTSDDLAEEAAAQDLKDYVPEGQDALAHDLFAYMGKQVEEAAGRWNALKDNCPDFEWRMSAAWAQEVRKLGNAGYPVKTSDQYGVPELKEL
jgi:hypothetical protein